MEGILTCKLTGMQYKVINTNPKTTKLKCLGTGLNNNNIGKITTVYNTRIYNKILLNFNLKDYKW